MAEGYESKIINNLGIKPINPLQCGVQKCPGDYSFGPAMRDFWILHFIISGKGVLTKGDATYSVSENEIFVIAPYETAYYKADSEHPWQYIWIGFSSEMPLPKILTENNVLSAPHLRDTFISAYYDEFFTKAYTVGTYEYFLCGKIWEILGKLLQSDQKPLTVYESYIRPAIAMMHSEFTSVLTVEEIAKKLNLSYGYFEQIFKTETGITPKKYMNELRLRKAVLLMLQRNCSVTVAASSVGYPDIFAFSRAFKKYYGCSPTEYIKTHSEKKATLKIYSKDI